MTRFAENVKKFNDCVQAKQTNSQYNQFNKENFFTVTYMNRQAVNDCYLQYPVESTVETAAVHQIAVTAQRALRFSPGFGEVKGGLTEKQAALLRYSHRITQPTKEKQNNINAGDVLLLAGFGIPLGTCGAAFWTSFERGALMSLAGIGRTTAFGAAFGLISGIVFLASLTKNWNPLPTFQDLNDIRNNIPL